MCHKLKNKSSKRKKRMTGDKRRDRKDEGMKGGGGSVGLEGQNNGAAHLMVNLNGG